MRRCDDLRASPGGVPAAVTLGRMCGIVGYTGPRQALPLVLEGLRRLEYRGYDSAGVVVLDRDGAAPQLNLAKKAGRIGNLEAFIDTGAVALAGTTGSDSVNDPRGHAASRQRHRRLCHTRCNGACP